MCCPQGVGRPRCSNICEVGAHLHLRITSQALRQIALLLPQTLFHAAHRTQPKCLRRPLAAELGYTGAKLGCGEGGCGACTVMVSGQEPDGQLTHRSINACLCPLYAVEGKHVVTTEGIGNARDGLHPVQERLANAHGSQCGFCTPGFVMSMYSLLRSKTDGPPTEEEIEENLAGNLW